MKLLRDLKHWFQKKTRRKAKQKERDYKKWNLSLQLEVSLFERFFYVVWIKFGVGREGLSVMFLRCCVWTLVSAIKRGMVLPSIANYDALLLYFFMAPLVLTILDVLYRFVVTLKLICQWKSSLLPSIRSVECSNFYIIL